MSEYASPRTLEMRIGDNFAIMVGYTEHLAKQLIIKSQESLISATNPDDANERFRDLGTFERWQRAGKQIVYMLTNSERNDLGGIAWYKPAVLPRVPQLNPAPNHSFGMRLYRGYDNKSLALPFMAATLEDYIVKSENGVKITEFGGIWLRTVTTNKLAVRAYERFGYEAVANDKGTVTMVLSPKRIPRALSSVG